MCVTRVCLGFGWRVVVSIHLRIRGVAVAQCKFTPVGLRPNFPLAVAAWQSGRLALAAQEHAQTNDFAFTKTRK